jgi:hypothetical protein
MRPAIRIHGADHDLLFGKGLEVLPSQPLQQISRAACSRESWSTVTSGSFASCFNRERQPKQVSTLRILSHLIPRKAIAGVSTSMPNCGGIAFSLGERAIRSSRAAQN